MNASSTTLAIICCVALGGCSEPSSDERLDVFPGRGRVSVGGLPAPGVLVVLVPAPGSAAAQAGFSPSATTDADGTFELSTRGQNDGAPAGKYAVTIQWFQVSDKPRPGPGMVPGFAPRVDYFRGRYKSPHPAPGPIDIIEGENVLQPIDIK